MLPPFDNALGFAISDNPADASSWTAKTVGAGDRNHVEYPRIKVDRQGNIYLFFIHIENNAPAHKRWYYYVKSEDAGTTWTELILSLQRELDDPYGMCEMYVNYTSPANWLHVWFVLYKNIDFLIL